MGYPYSLFVHNHCKTNTNEDCIRNVHHTQVLISVRACAVRSDVNVYLRISSEVVCALSRKMQFVFAYYSWKSLWSPVAQIILGISHRQLNVILSKICIKVVCNVIKYWMIVICYTFAYFNFIINVYIYRKHFFKIPVKYCSNIHHSVML